MKEPTFDSDGYPTEETLETIRKWDHTDNFRILMEYIEKAWRYSDTYFEKLLDIENNNWIYTLHTFGWSGNEDLIGAMKQNTLFWMLSWLESRRGGHYKFMVYADDVE